MGERGDSVFDHQAYTLIHGRNGRTFSSGTDTFIGSTGLPKAGVLETRYESVCGNIARLPSDALLGF